jgi:hypothetical protein
MNVNYKKAIILLLFIAGVLSGVSVYLQTIDVATIAPEWQPAWNCLIYVFITGAGGTAFTFLRNILGFAYTYFEGAGKIVYDKNQLYATWARFEFYMLTISQFIQVATAGTKYAPYAVTIAGAISVMLDLGLRSLSNVASAIREA